MTEQELEKIYNEAYRAVYWTAYSLLKNEDDAEDIVQDTFVSLIHSYDGIKDKSKIVPWLKKVAANKALNRLTRTRTDNVEDEFLENAETVPEDFLPDSIVESEDTRRIIMDIINSALSEDVRRTLILFYFDEMSTREISEALGIPEGTVSWRISSAKKKIKKEVEKYEEENNTKLYGMPVPFLTLLFRKEAEQVPLRTMSASLRALSASTEALKAGAAKNAAAAAIKKGTGIMMKKVIIGSIAAIAVVGVTLGIVLVVTNKKDDETSVTKKKKKENAKVEERISLDDDDSEVVEEPTEEEEEATSAEPGSAGYCAVGKIETICGTFEFKETFGEFLEELAANDQITMSISDYEGNHYTVDQLDTVVTTRYLGVNVFCGYDLLMSLDSEKVEGTSIRDCKISHFSTSGGTIAVEIAGNRIEIDKTTIDEAVAMLGDYQPRTPTEESMRSYQFDLSDYELNCYTWTGNEDGTLDHFFIYAATFL